MNNASISGYAYFPAATTYAASKAGVVAFTESLRRELKDTGVTHASPGHPGVDTDMLDATEDIYGRYLDTSDWQKQQPDEWAAKVVERDPRRPHGARPGRQDGPRQASVTAAPASCSIGSPTGCSAAAPALPRSRPRHSGLANTICTSPMRASRKPAST